MQCLVKEVPSGDSLRLLKPKQRDGGEIYRIAGVKAPAYAKYNQGHQTPDEYGAWDAREFLRAMLIGQVVDVQFLPSNFVTVAHKGVDVALKLVQAGLVDLNTEDTNSCPSNVDQLLKAYEQRTLPELSPPRAIKWAVGDPTAIQVFVNEHKSKEVDTVIEVIRHGSKMECFLPEHALYCQVLITGVQAEVIREGQKTNALADQARNFVEMRLLNRRIKFRVDGTDGYGNLFGTPLHPNGDIATLLVAEGLVTLHEPSCRYLASTTHLREALHQARSKNLGRWKEPNAPKQVGGKAPATPARVVETYEAVILECFSADCFSVVPTTKGKEISPFAAMQNERRLYLASVRCPRPRTRTRNAEPWGHEAKELALGMIVGKVCKVSVDYKRLPIPPANGGDMPTPSDDNGMMHFVTIEVGGKCLNVELCAKGFAKAIRHRADEDRSSRYPEILNAEDQAMTNKIGIHSNGQPPAPPRINDLTGPSNVRRAKEMMTSFTHEGVMTCRVEQVMNGGRYRVFCESHSALISFALSGVRAPQPGRMQNGVVVEGQVFAEEAICWAKLKLLYRKFRIEVTACDRSGTFIGLMYPIHVAFGKGVSVQELLLKDGFGMINADGIGRCSIGDKLSEAQAEAYEKGIGMWEMPEIREEFGEDGYSRQEKDSEACTLKNVKVSHVNSIKDFFVQKDLDKLGELHKLCQESSAYGEDAMDRMLSRGDVILAKYDDGEWYRAEVIGTVAKTKQASLRFVDYGNTITVAVDDMENVRRCPAQINLVCYPAHTMRMELALIKEMEDDTAEVFDELTNDKILECVVLARKGGKKDGVRECVLLSESGESINETLLKMGSARISKEGLRKELPEGVWKERMIEAEKWGRENRCGMWRYGDVGDSDDDLG